MCRLHDMSSKNGYVRLSTVDPDESGGVQLNKPSALQPDPPNLRPGLFVAFSKHRVPPSLERLHDDTEGIEMSRMKPRRTKHRKPKSPSTKKPRQELVVEPLIPGDTLQRVSLRYGCPVAELRRVNKLYSDQDFHALKTIKIPVAEHSVLTESSERERRRRATTVQEHSKSGTQNSGGTSGTSGTSGDDMRFGGPETYYSTGEESQDADDEGDESDEAAYSRHIVAVQYVGTERIVRLKLEGYGQFDLRWVLDHWIHQRSDLSIHSALKWKHSREILLSKVDEDLQRVKDNVEEQKSNVNEVHLTLSAPTIHPVMMGKGKSLLTFDLPDWRVLLPCAIIVIVLLSTFFFLVIVVKPWKWLS